MILDFSETFMLRQLLEFWNTTGLQKVTLQVIISIVVLPAILDLLLLIALWLLLNVDQS